MHTHFVTALQQQSSPWMRQEPSAAVDMDCCCTSAWVVSDWTAGSAAVKQRPQVERQMWNCVSNISVMQQSNIVACCDDS